MGTSRKIIAASVVGALVLGISVAYRVMEETRYDAPRYAPIAPDWAAIAGWPGQEGGDIDAQPDPNRVYTAIVLDDSGSMGSDIEAAKRAVTASLDAMDDQDAVAVFALNRGLILPFMPAAEARRALPAPLSRVTSDGNTPLTPAIAKARAALEVEGARVGGFGTYRILVTTDGAANNGDALRREIEDIARVTPIQLATIGVGISGNHVLRRPDLAAFVAIKDVSDLASALRSAVAEEQTFKAITSFGSN